MNTPAHLIFGLAAFGKPNDRAVTSAALAGAIIPDLSLYLLASWHLFVLETPARVVFGRLYYSENWQAIFRIDNSFVLWGIALGVGILFKSRVAIALCGAAFLHISLDFPFHNEDARAHFWPVTNWKFVSPISYWDPKYFGHFFGPVEIAAALTLSIWLWRKFTGRFMRALILLLSLIELAPGIAFAVMFARGA